MIYSYLVILQASWGLWGLSPPALDSIFLQSPHTHYGIRAENSPSESNGMLAVRSRSQGRFMGEATSKGGPVWVFE